MIQPSNQGYVIAGTVDEQKMRDHIIELSIEHGSAILHHHRKSQPCWQAEKPCELYKDGVISYNG